MYHDAVQMRAAKSKQFAPPKVNTSRERPDSTPILITACCISMVFLASSFFLLLASALRFVSASGSGDESWHNSWFSDSSPGGGGGNAPGNYYQYPQEGQQGNHPSQEGQGLVWDYERGLWIQQGGGQQPSSWGRSYEDQSGPPDSEYATTTAATSTYDPDAFASHLGRLNIGGRANVAAAAAEEQQNEPIGSMSSRLYGRRTRRTANVAEPQTARVGGSRDNVRARRRERAAEASGGGGGGGGGERRRYDLPPAEEKVGEEVYSGDPSWTPEMWRQFYVGWARHKVNVVTMPPEVIASHILEIKAETNLGEAVEGMARSVINAQAPSSMSRFINQVDYWLNEYKLAQFVGVPAQLSPNQQRQESSEQALQTVWNRFWLEKLAPIYGDYPVEEIPIQHLEQLARNFSVDPYDVETSEFYIRRYIETILGRTDEMHLYDHQRAIYDQQRESERQEMRQRLSATTSSSSSRTSRRGKEQRRQERRRRE